MVVVMEMIIVIAHTFKLDIDSPKSLLQGFLTNNEWDELLSKTDDMISELEEIKDKQTRFSKYRRSQCE